MPADEVFGRRTAVECPVEGELSEQACVAAQTNDLEDILAYIP